MAAALLMKNVGQGAWRQAEQDISDYFTLVASLRQKKNAQSLNLWRSKTIFHERKIDR